MSKANNLTEFLTAEANAIRAKKGYPSTQKINPQNFASEIESIVSTPSLQSKTVYPSRTTQIVKPDTTYYGLSQVTVQPAQLESKVVTPTTSAQTINPSAAYIGLTQVTVNAISPTKSVQTYIPTTKDQIIPNGRWLTGDQTIKGDVNLVAGNIKKDVTIFGVKGTYGGPNSGEKTIREYMLEADDTLDVKGPCVLCLTFGEDDTSAAPGDFSFWLECGGDFELTIPENNIMYLIITDSNSLYAFTMHRDGTHISSIMYYPNSDVVRINNEILQGTTYFLWVKEAPNLYYGEI